MRQDDKHCMNCKLYEEVSFLNYENSGCNMRSDGLNYFEIKPEQNFALKCKSYEALTQGELEI